jgi:hypothetical protein
MPWLHGAPKLTIPSIRMYYAGTRRVGLLATHSSILLVFVIEHSFLISNNAIHSKSIHYVIVQLFYLELKDLRDELSRLKGRVVATNDKY